MTQSVEGAIPPQYTDPLHGPNYRGNTLGTGKISEGQPQKRSVCLGGGPVIYLARSFEFNFVMFVVVFGNSVRYFMLYLKHVFNMC